MVLMNLFLQRINQLDPLGSCEALMESFICCCVRLSVSPAAGKQKEMKPYMTLYKPKRHFSHTEALSMFFFRLSVIFLKASRFAVSKCKDALISILLKNSLSCTPFRKGTIFLAF